MARALGLCLTFDKVLAQRRPAAQLSHHDQRGGLVVAGGPFFEARADKGQQTGEEALIHSLRTRTIGNIPVS